MGEIRSQVRPGLPSRARQPVRLPAGLRALASSSMAECALVLLLVFALGMPSLLYPFARDQGEYAYTAVAALEGKVVYRDVFNVKPPMTHLVHELALVAFGRSMLAIRLLDLLWQGATALVIMLIARRTWGRRSVGLLAAFLYALLYYQNGFWETAQTDGFLILPASLGLLAFLAACERDWGWAYCASGVALGIATLFKYPIGILFPLLAILTLWPRRPLALRRALQMALGFVAPILLTVVALAAQGALRDLLAIELGYIPAYTAGRGRYPYVISALHSVATLHSYSILLWPSATALAGQFINAIRKRTWRQLLPVAFFWLAALVSLAAQNKASLYHALPLLAPEAIILAPLPFAAYESRSLARPLRIALVLLAETALLLPLLLHLTRGYPENYTAVAEVARGEKPLSAIYGDPAFMLRHGSGVFSVWAQLQTASYIEAHSTPQDQVFIWGFEPTIYFLSQRACASRFIYNYPLYGEFPWTSLREEFLQEMQRTQPLYVVVVSRDAIPWVTGTTDDSWEALIDFYGLRDLIATHYHRETEIGRFSIYRRNT